MAEGRKVEPFVTKDPDHLAVCSRAQKRKRLSPLETKDSEADPTERHYWPHMIFQRPGVCVSGGLTLNNSGCEAGDWLRAFCACQRCCRAAQRTGGRPHILGIRSRCVLRPRGSCPPRVGTTPAFGHVSRMRHAESTESPHFVGEQ